MHGWPGKRVTREGDVLARIHRNFMFVFKFQECALGPPTFDRDSVAKISRLIEKIKGIETDTRLQQDSNRLFAEQAASSVNELAELLEGNFLSRTVRNLQEQIRGLSDKFTAVLGVSKERGEVKSMARKGIEILDNVMPQVLLLGCQSAGNEVFSHVAQTMDRMANDFESVLAFEGRILEIAKFAQHVAAAHGFIRNCESMVNNLMKLKSDFVSACLPLKSHEILLKPKWPKVIPSIEKSSVGTIRWLLHHFGSMYRKQFCSKFRKKMERHYCFRQPQLLIKEILHVILRVQFPVDSLKTRLRQTEHVCRTVSNWLRAYCLLKPHLVPKDPSLEEFCTTFQLMKTKVLNFCRQKKKLAWFLDYNDKVLVSEFFQMSQDLDRIVEGLEFVEQANNLMKEQCFYLDISSLKAEIVETRFVVATTEHGKVRVVNALSGINEIATELMELKGVHILDSIHPRRFHPPSLKRVCQGINNLCERLEPDLFVLLDTYQYKLDNAHQCASILSYFAQFEHDIEQMILQMHLLPLNVVDIRDLSTILYHHGFPTANDELIVSILKELEFLLNFFVMLGKLSQRGVLSLSSFCQITYLVTMCDELSEESSVFTKHQTAFHAIDAFKIDNESLRQDIHALHDVIVQELATWTLQDIIDDFNKYTETLHVVQSTMRENGADPNAVAMLREFIVWVSGLSSSKPSQCSVREMQIKIRVFKKSFLHFAGDHKELGTKLPVKEMLTITTFCTSLRRRFDYKRKLKRLLQFVARIPFNTNGNVLTTDTVEHVASDELPTRFSSFHFTDVELAPWPSFGKSCCGQIPSATGSLSPQLIYLHFTNLVEKPNKWMSDREFGEQIGIGLKELVAEKGDMAPERVREIFASNHGKVQAFLSGCFDYFGKCLASASDFVTNMSVAATLKTSGAAALNVEFNDIKQRLRNSDFLSEAVVRLGECIAQLDDKQEELASKLERLRYDVYVCFQCVRCFTAFQSRAIKIEPDILIVKGLLARILEDSFLTRCGESVKQKQLTTWLGCELNDDDGDALTVEILRKSAELLQTKLIVETIDKSLCYLQSRFSMTRCGERWNLFTDKLFLLGTKVQSLLFDLLSDEYNCQLVTDTCVYIKQMQGELGHIASDLQPLLTAIRNMGLLLHTAHIVDVMNVFWPKGSHQLFLPSSTLFGIKIAIEALMSRVENLLLLSHKFANLYRLLTDVVVAHAAIPQAFGLSAVDGPLQSFVDSWARFCDSVQPVCVDSEWVSFSMTSRRILEKVKNSIKNRSALDELCLLIECLSTGRELSACFPLILAFVSLEAWYKEHSGSPDPVPFGEVQISLKTLLLFHEVCSIIQYITTMLNTIRRDKQIPTPRLIQSGKPALIEVPDSCLVEEQLSMAEQTKLVVDVKLLQEANLCEQERLADMPLVQRDIVNLHRFVARGRLGNDILKLVNEILAANVNDDHAPALPTDDSDDKMTLIADGVMSYADRLATLPASPRECLPESVTRATEHAKLCRQLATSLQQSIDS